jgi:hypothetical protein
VGSIAAIEADRLCTSRSHQLQEHRRQSRLADPCIPVDVNHPRLARRAAGRRGPESVLEALGELARAAKEGLLALSAGVGLGVLRELMEAEDDAAGVALSHQATAVVSDDIER